MDGDCRDVARRFVGQVGRRRDFVGWARYFLHGLGVCVHLICVRWSTWTWMGAVLFVRGLDGLWCCLWGSAHLVCVLWAGRFTGVGQVGREFCCVDWVAMIDFFWRVRLAATHAKGLYFPLLR